ncbi:HIT-like domain-containing protein [Lipomyces kononenkoae]
MTKSPAEPCVFCAIASSVPIFDPLRQPGCSQQQQKYPASFDQHNVILSTRSYIALLDLQPLVSSRCHVLLIPRMHYERISDFPPAAAAAAAAAAGDTDLVNRDLGGLLALLGRALCNSFRDVTDFNIIQNNGPAAGQIVSHVHFHIVARPPPTATATSTSTSTYPDSSSYASLIYGKGAREDLDPEIAGKICHVLRRYLYHNYWCHNQRQRTQIGKL